MIGRMEVVFYIIVELSESKYRGRENETSRWLLNDVDTLF